MKELIIFLLIYAGILMGIMVGFHLASLPEYEDFDGDEHERHHH